jgi:hypothetical protein
MLMDQYHQHDTSNHLLTMPLNTLAMLVLQQITQSPVQVNTPVKHHILVHFEQSHCVDISTQKPAQACAKGGLQKCVMEDQ